LFSTPNRNVFPNSHETVILRGCDFFDFLIFGPGRCSPGQAMKSPGGTAGSCLIQDHVSVNSLRRPGGTFKGRTLTQALRPISANPFEMFFQTPHKTVILSEAPRKSIAQQRVHSA
jgi:hypothetical protein